MTKSKKKKTKQRAYRHPFRFHIEGIEKPLVFYAKVVDAKEIVRLDLKLEDVQQSKIANTQKCSMALCAKRQEKAFPHAVMGLIDWTYSRAWVVSKTDDKGFPSECVLYGHNDIIARLNDTEAGRKKLISLLKAKGNRTVNLYPVKTRIGGGKATGTGEKRKKNVISLKGESLRYAYAEMGGIVQ
jgi:hypothetical protein